MKVAGIIKNSVANGIGIRDVIFLQGCEHQCKGCHNPETWNKDDGIEINKYELASQFLSSNNHMTISGGEPILQYEEVIEYMKLVHSHEGKRFWLYTGFKIEELPPEMVTELAKYVDVLVDGRFELEKKDLTLRFRGSSNQRLIDLPKTVEENKIVLWEDR